jgi:hypothetical protein
MDASYLFGIAAVLVVLLKAWQGWRLGVVRQLVNIAALLVAVGFGWLVARFAGTLLGGVLPLPARALGPVGGLLAGLVVYGALVLTGAVLFKRTKDQSVALVRVFYGLAGAGLGALYGLALVVALGTGLHLLGAVEEARLAIDRSPHLAAARTPRRDALAERLAAFRHGADDGPLGAIFRRIDPVPDSAYSFLGRISQLMADSRSIERFLGSPELRPVVEHPKVTALFRDPELNRMILERRYFSILSNPAVIAAADDPEVMRRLRAVPWDRAFDHALRKREVPK